MNLRMNISDKSDGEVESIRSSEGESSSLKRPKNIGTKNNTYELFNYSNQNVINQAAPLENTNKGI